MSTTTHNVMQVRADRLRDFHPVCHICCEPIESADDGEDGIWVACECDQGYVSRHSYIPILDNGGHHL